MLSVPIMELTGISGSDVDLKVNSVSVWLSSFSVGRSETEMAGDLGCCSKCLFIGLTALLLIGGLTSLSVGVWLIDQKKWLEYMTVTNLYITGAAVLVTAGGVSIITGIIGCIGAFKEVKSLLVTYFLFIILVFLMMLISGVLGFLFHQQVTESLEENMLTSLKFHYGDYDTLLGAFVTNAWDKVQSEYGCCAVNSTEESGENYQLWINSHWHSSLKLFPRERVPRSCCKPCRKLLAEGYCNQPDTDAFDVAMKRDICERRCNATVDLHNPVNLEMCQGTTSSAVLYGRSPTFLNMKGCYDVVEKELDRAAWWIGGVGVVISSLLVLSMATCLCLYRSVDL